jgi:REP element-mobilizing transposase RayT
MQQVLSKELKMRVVHGGELSRGTRKRERPIACKKPMHIVLKSTLAKREWSLLAPRNARYVREVLPRLAKRFHVQVYRQANVGNHIHLAIRGREREALKRFLMAVTGRIAQFVTGARKGKPLGKRFWDYIPWSRIVEWRKAFRTVCEYIEKNVSNSPVLFSWDLTPCPDWEFLEAPS